MYLVQSNFRMSDRLKSLFRCTQVRIKKCRKEYDWSMRLIYDPRGWQE
jgi:hypothetical protein